MGKSSRIECGFCFHKMKVIPKSASDLIQCKRCGEKIDWQNQVDMDFLDRLTQHSAAPALPAFDDTINIPHGQFGYHLSQMPWQVRIVAIVHGVVMFIKGCSLIAMLISKRNISPGVLIFELMYIMHSLWTFYGIHYRSRSTWLWLKNLSKLFMIIATFIGFLGLIAVARRPPLLPILPVLVFAWLYFSMDYLLLKTKEARLFFRVVCPKCGSLKSKPGNTEFSFVKCKECKHTWE